MAREYAAARPAAEADPDRATAPAAAEAASDLAARLRAARTDPATVVLEGAHALKHALRFGAEVSDIATPDRAGLLRLLAEVAPDVRAEVAARAVELGAEAWERAIGRALPSPALSLARRPVSSADTVLRAHGTVVVLEQPRHLGNLGAVIRVAAAAGAGGVLVIGDADPWHPIVVRGAAGLHFAVPVARSDRLGATDRPLVALDGTGPAGPLGPLADDVVLLVGTERGGLSHALRARATRTVAIPMREGVSSLNLATAVAVALYAGR